MHITHKSDRFDSTTQNLSVYTILPGIESITF